MSLAATSWAMRHSQTDAAGRMALIALAECSSSGDDTHAGYLRSWESAASFAQMDVREFREAIAEVVALGELRITERDDGSISWVIFEENRSTITPSRRAACIDSDPKDSVVYVIGSTESNLVKIGRSINVAARLRSIQNMSPAPLTVLWSTPGGHVLESRLHAVFAAYRTHGEWFDFGAADPIQTISAEVSRRSRGAA